MMIIVICVVLFITEHEYGVDNLMVISDHLVVG